MIDRIGVGSRNKAGEGADSAYALMFLTYPRVRLMISGCRVGFSPTEPTNK